MKASFIVMAAVLLPGAAGAAEIKVLSTQATEQAYRELAPQYEQASGHKVTTVFTGTLDVQKRIAAGESYDIILMAGPAIDDFIKAGKVVPGSRVDLARSYIGLAVRAGTPKPDIGTVEALKRTLLDAKSIAFSDSASGVYLSTELFPRLGIWDQIKDKSRMIPAEPVGAVVARGDAEVGFQQMSELKAVRGIEIVGALPASAQKVTVFSAGIVAGAKEPVAAKALVDFLASPPSAEAITKSGMEPANAR